MAGATGKGTRGGDWRGQRAGGSKRRGPEARGAVGGKKAADAARRGGAAA